LVLLSVFVWAYWPTLAGLVSAWETEPDYSHGYLVVPLALFFLWARRDLYPTSGVSPGWFGLVLILASLALRWAGERYFISAFDGWSIILWVAGAVWLIGGPRLFAWCWPSVAFLFFMVPLPFRAESWFSLPLQQVATRISTFALQCLGQPALAEGNTILVGDFQLEVAQACSGLRVFMGIVALGFAFVVVTRQPWWQKALVLAGVVPIALLTNATRIVTTACLYRCVSSEAAMSFAHDLSGLLMVPVAGAMFVCLLWYLSCLFRVPAISDLSELVRYQRRVGIRKWA